MNQRLCAGPRRRLWHRPTHVDHSIDTSNATWQFIDAYDVDYATRDHRLVIDDPEVRRRLIKVIDG